MKLKNNKYRTISEVSKILKINTHVIRYWDSKFDGISLRLSNKKQRYFNNENIKKIKELHSTLYNNNGKQINSLSLADKILNRKKNINEKVDINNKKTKLILDLKKINQNLKKLYDI